MKGMTNAMNLATAQRSGSALLALAMTGSMLLAGCGNTANEPAAPTATPDTAPAAPEAPAAPATSPEAAPAAAEATPPPAPVTPEARIASAANFVALDELRRDFQKDGVASAELDAAVAARRDALVAEMTPRTLVDGLDLLDVVTRVTGKSEYTISLLFRPTKDLATDYHLSFDGFVHTANLKKLSEKNRERGLIKLPRKLADQPTSTWKAGQLYTVHTKAEVPLIPYNLRLLAFSPTEESFWNHVGQRLNLGWQWAYRDGSDFIRLVKDCRTPAELFALAPAGPRVNPAVQKAIDAKWAALTKDAKPQAMAEGLEFLALDTKATGEREYTFSFLVRATADLNADYIFSVIGGVDPGHVKHIRPAKPGANYAAWNFELKHDPVSAWKKDQYHVAQLVVESEIIPYDISLWVSPRGEDGKWDWEKKGKRIDLGWQADIRK